ncbi:MAG: alpha-L-fucosidase [Flavobacteriaceae bacterium]|nr:alpha-L-fucosidase [Flavobacteriaceae bacterium]
MKKKNLIIAFVFSIFLLISCKDTPAPTPFGAVPSDSQVAWQEMEKYAFVHFSLNTFTGAEWGYGDVSAEVFNPSEVDCKQWVKVFKNAGLKGVIITAKHHDGFCLWPSKYTDYSVKNSPWRNGKGDLIRELSDACKEAGLKFGVYLSPWDRNYKDYGKPVYVTYFRNQLKELLTNYGDVFEVWFDGANGGTGYYGGAKENRKVDNKTYYDWENTQKLVLELQPNAIIFSDNGQGCRWCGTEAGWVGETNWSTLNRAKVWSGYDKYEELRYGHEDGTHWVPAEVDVSIRPGWFYHSSEDHKVKSVPQLVDIYYHSVGRNGNLLLNFPINKKGLISENDIAHLQQMTQILKEDFADNLAKNTKVKASNVRGNDSKYEAKNVIDTDKNTYWATDDDVKEASLTLRFDEPTAVNRLLLQEDIRLGQRVSEFSVFALVDDKWKLLDKQTTVGYKRILRFSTVTTTAVKIDFKAKACLVISNVALYNAPKLLTLPTIQRNQNDEVSISVADKEAKIYYTIDGTTPTKNSMAYKSPFVFSKKGVIKAICMDNSTEKISPVATQKFDISQKEWKIVNNKDDKCKLIFDGNPTTVWHQNSADLVVDLGKMQTLKGFTYLPDQGRWASGIIFNYAFYVSQNGKQWKKVDNGEFSNIKNSPILQIKTFKSTKARYVKLQAVSVVDNAKNVGYAEFGVLTE